MGGEAAPPPAVGVVTGFTGEIGFEIVRKVTQHAHVIVPVRDEAKAATLVQRITSEAAGASIEVVPNVDLASIASIEAFCAQIADRKLNFLVNNAAVTTQLKSLSRDGVELMFAVNVLAYQLLITRLAPQLEGGRIVNVASDYAGAFRGDDLVFDARRFSCTAAYQQSKAADRMLTAEASRRYASIKINACHPGVVTSPLLKALMGDGGQGWDTAEAAADTPAYLAVAPEIEARKVTGRYFASRSPQKCEFATQIDNQRALWEFCDALVARHGDTDRAFANARRAAGAGDYSQYGAFYKENAY